MCVQHFRHTKRIEQIEQEHRELVAQLEQRITTKENHLSKVVGDNISNAFKIQTGIERKDGRSWLLRSHVVNTVFYLWHQHDAIVECVPATLTPQKWEKRIQDAREDLIESSSTITLQLIRQKLLEECSEMQDEDSDRHDDFVAFFNLIESTWQEKRK